MNELVADLVHRLERRGPGRFFTRDEVIDEFRSHAARAGQYDPRGVCEL
jgi:hypothetical protein